MAFKTPKLLVFDVDNTLFDWMPYYAKSNSALLFALSEMIGVPYVALVREFKDLMAHHETSRDSFVVPGLPSMASRLGSSSNAEIYKKCTDIFLQKAAAALVPYPGTVVTLSTVKMYRPHIKIVALTDSPCLEAVWKIVKLGLASYFDGIYGLNNPPIIPTAEALAEILASSKDYHGIVKMMPASYEKPSTKGLESIMADFGLNSSEKDEVIYVGDNVKKDVSLGKKVGVLTCLSEFSSPSDSPYLQETLFLSPKIKITKNVPNSEDLRIKPDTTLHKFSDILQHLF